MKTIEEFNAELEYIQKQSVEASGGNWRKLKSFNCDYDCFDRYIEMQANQARKAGFPGIAEQMLKQRL
jgi:hypothetical protein